MAFYRCDDDPAAARRPSKRSSDMALPRADRPASLRSRQTAERRALQRERRRLKAEVRREQNLGALRQECDALRRSLRFLLDGDVVPVTADRIGPAPLPGLLDGTEAVYLTYPGGGCVPVFAGTREECDRIRDSLAIVGLSRGDRPTIHHAAPSLDGYCHQGPPDYEPMFYDRREPYLPGGP